MEKLVCGGVMKRVWRRWNSSSEKIPETAIGREEETARFSMKNRPSASTNRKQRGWREMHTMTQRNERRRKMDLVALLYRFENVSPHSEFLVPSTIHLTQLPTARRWSPLSAPFGAWIFHGNVPGATEDPRPEAEASFGPGRSLEIIWVSFAAYNFRQVIQLRRDRGQTRVRDL